MNAIQNPSPLDPSVYADEEHPPSKESIIEELKKITGLVETKKKLLALFICVHPTTQK